MFLVLSTRCNCRCSTVHLVGYVWIPRMTMFSPVFPAYHWCFQYHPLVTDLHNVKRSFLLDGLFSPGIHQSFRWLWNVCEGTWRQTHQKRIDGTNHLTFLPANKRFIFILNKMFNCFRLFIFLPPKQISTTLQRGRICFIVQWNEMYR